MNNKQFKISELFLVETGKDLLYSFLTPGKYNVIGHGIENNGITATTGQLDNYKIYDPKKTIALANRGNFYASVQSKEFYIGTRVKALTAKFESNEYILMYIATIINKEQFRYSYGRNACDKIEDILIMLPVTKDGTPDYKYMEEFIKNKCNPNILKTKNHIVKKINDTSNWELFKLSDIFTMHRGTRLIESDRETGNVPFVTAGYLNEGIAEKINNLDLKKYSNALTIDMFGNCFYRDYEFFCDDNILVLQNKRLNKYMYLFIATVINKDNYRYNYGRQYRQKDYLKQMIKLPSKDNLPDYEYMEQYIKQLPYADLI